jgi:hypothetical protein
MHTGWSQQIYICTILHAEHLRDCLLVSNAKMNQLEAALEAQQCRDMLAAFLKLGPEGELYTPHSTLFASNITRQHAPLLLTSRRASFKALCTDC